MPTDLQEATTVAEAELTWRQLLPRRALEKLLGLRDPIRITKRVAGRERHVQPNDLCFDVA